MKKLITLMCAALLFSCGGKSSKEEQTTTASSAPTITSAPFDKLPDGTQIDKYTLEAKSGEKIEIITYGGIITSWMVPDKNGNLGDVVLGHDSMEGYLLPSPYFGALIGRYGNRIAKGKFTLDGETYELATNNDANHLHGGNVGFDKVVWAASEIKNENSTGLLLKYTSPDGEEGYPGTLNTEVTYMMDEDGSLEISYSATTDKKTIVNLTNHSYFNLGEDKSSILNHELTLYADRFLPVDKTLIPTGELRSVSGTPFDFTSSKQIGKEINEENQQLEFGGGYDHCWVLTESAEKMQKAAELYEPQSGRLLQVYTTEPAIQFYSGNFLDGSITGKGGQVYPYRSGLCLETQHYPDSPNQPDFPSVVLNPGETYSTTTKLVFSTK